LLNAARVEALLSDAFEGDDGGPAGAAHWVQVISAFDVPKIQYDPIRKSFYRAPQPTGLLGTAEVLPSNLLTRTLAFLSGLQTLECAYCPDVLHSWP
jgi:hypothetical protein